MLLLSFVIVSNVSLASAKTTSKSDSYSAYNVVGLKVCYVKFTADHKFGVPTPWGTVGYNFRAINLSVKF